MRMIRAIAKSIGWNITNSVISLLQLGALLIYSRVSHVIPNWGKLLFDGSMLFFCSSSVASILLEYYSERKNSRVPQFFEAVFFVAFPLVIVFTIAVLYSSCIAVETPDYGFMKDMTILLVAASLAYSLIYRSIRFYKRGTR
jgi:hypothetical protein